MNFIMGETVKLNLEITIPKRWVKKFFQMLDCMRVCGNVGASRTVAFYADGDGDFRPFDFKVNGKEVQTYFGKTWNIHDNAKVPEDINVPCPPFKTRRKVDFFFDAG